ncbi:MAG: S8 family serine peptidase [Actinobacteria bacterium]|nr:S8 family serine peptidase [Actinomycetota bacterium]
MRRRSLVALAVLVGALVVPELASAGRLAIGLDSRAQSSEVVAALEGRGARLVENLAPIPAIIVELPVGRSLAGIRGIRYVEPLRSRRLALVPNDPFVSRQWYLTRSRFYESWLTYPAFEQVPVAVIDSGADLKHPELVGRVLDAKSFVGGSPSVDPLGHGTFVSGLIAASVDNGVGIAGLAPSAELLVAKVVTPSRTIPIDAEVRAIRWAVDRGARVINMSLGGVRDPLEPDRDTFSRLEADAVAFAVENGVVVVAAVGNDDQAPASPWSFASYPAALPHVLGVSAVTQIGNVPRFSNRDKIYNDLAAPGEQIFSTFPRPLTSRFPACADQGFSSCGPDEYRQAQGTSFSAPQASAAAAILFSLRPELGAEQVTAILESTAIDANVETGCAACAVGRDALSGWGSLDVAAAIAALSKPLPVADRYEANDDAGSRAASISVKSGGTRHVQATVDFWDDQDDVYAIRLEKGKRVYLGLTGAVQDADLSLALWLPKTRFIEDVRAYRLRARVSTKPGGREYFSYRPAATGTFFVQVRISNPGTTSYRLRIVKG